jgi:hypothetical protein
VTDVLKCGLGWEAGDRVLELLIYTWVILGTLSLPYS